MLCNTCGNQNPADKQFCGTCGARLERRVAGSERRHRARRVATQRVSERRTAIGPARISVAKSTPPWATEQAEGRASGPSFFEHEPSPPQTTVGGPSFLGLGQPESDYDYDEYQERGRRRGGRGLLAILVILGAAALFWVQLRNESLSKLLHANEKQSAKPAGPQAPAKSSNPTSTMKNSTEGESKPQMEVVPSAKSKEARNEDKSSTNAAGEKKSSEAAASEDNPAAGAVEGKKNPEQKTAGKLDEKESAGKDQASSEEDTAASESMGRAKSAPLPSDAAGLQRASSEGNTDASVRLAEMYLQGRGVPQSCDQATNLLRSAANRGNAKAQIKLGALHATGQCVPLDRVAAYRWFARASQSEPHNSYVDHSRRMLWAQMSDAEKSEISSGPQ